MSDFIAVARADDLAPGLSRLVTVSNLCLHRGGPIADGHLSGHLVTCPWHGWQYDVTTGRLVQDPKAGLTSHETRVVSGDVQVRLAD
jgi:nitrite reductase (NADH) small subunit